VTPASPSSDASDSRPRRLSLLLAAYLLAALAAVLSRDVLATATPPTSFDSRAMVSRAAVGASQARTFAVREVLAAEITRPTPPPAPPAPAAMPAARVSPPSSSSDGAVSGIATWYGGSDGYDSDDTMADGSLFNPDDPTIAAANAWPLGAWLLVCHDGRCIRVRVRDRGTFSHAVDLSRGAFAQLAPLSSGVIDVTVQPLS
jgi:rare lipoprotein A (peptidoglycan hydrolase)